ncbi:hypothetical protein [Murdochiella vaginalis]|uniref:hypothetical protein n=1 Tax=Murdochiella vaginalis TaxID=1852373 RepID=UPI0008FE5E15|nr:hypothetical protein [Murdochiella vaginalis]
MSALLTADPLVEERPFTIPFHDPVHIRLAIHARGAACKTPDAYYLVLIGLFKLLRDLSVLSFRHSLEKDGLVFSLSVRESRSVVRSYLAETKKFHVLGDAWDLVLIDGARVSTVPGNGRTTPPLSAEMLHLLASQHRGMGSRPLRFSRYFLSSALLPYTRRCTYGCACMDAEDSRGKVNFYHVVQGLELLQRSFSSLDFSNISSTHELHIVADPLAKALQQIGRTPDFFAEELFPALLLACLYEQKVPLSAMEEALMRLSPASTEEGSHGQRLLWLRDLLGTDPDALSDPDAFSLFLLAHIVDATTRREMSEEQYREVQQLADLAYQEKGVDAEALNALFFANHLVTEGVQAAITCFSLLSYMQEEEQA